jgi:hypothetical protein
VPSVKPPNATSKNLTDAFVALMPVPSLRSDSY